MKGRNKALQAELRYDREYMTRLCDAKMEAEREWVRLEAEVERLENELLHWRNDAQADAYDSEKKEAEAERLREALRRIARLGQQHNDAALDYNGFLDDMKTIAEGALGENAPPVLSPAQTSPDAISDSGASR